MTIIPPLQARKRFRALSPLLQDGLFSIQTAEIIRMTCKENYLPAEKNPDVARVVGLVFLGYIHPEDFAREIEEGAKIKKEAAAAIADSINKKLFAPIRTELDAVYAPAPHEHELEAPTPKLVEEIKKPVPSPATGKPDLAPLDLGKIFSKTPASAEMKPPAPPVPSVTKPQIPPSPISAPKTTGSKPLSEFERLGLIQKETSLPTPSAQASGGQGREKGKEVAPTMLHKETETKLGEKVSGFKLEIPLPKLSEMKTDKMAPSKPAVLEFGTNGKSGASSPESAVPSAPRVVNYSGLRTPLSPISEIKPPTTETSIRSIKEVTLEKPKPAASIPQQAQKPISIPPFPFGGTKTPEPSKFAFDAKKEIPPSIFGGIITPASPAPRVEPPISIKPIVPEIKPFNLAQGKPPIPPSPKPTESMPRSIGIRPITPGSKPSLLGDEKMMHPSFGKLIENKPLSTSVPPPASTPPAPPRPRIEPPPVPPKPPKV